MLLTIEGIYRDGQIELNETPVEVNTGTRVLVTFLPSGSVDLEQRGIDHAQAAELRDRLAAFADDWNSPEMASYDDYEANRRKLEAG